MAKALTSSLDLDSILQTITEKMAEYFRPDTWSLLMVDESKMELYFAIAVGEASEALKNVRAFVSANDPGYIDAIDSASDQVRTASTRAVGPNFGYAIGTFPAGDAAGKARALQRLHQDERHHAWRGVALSAGGGSNRRGDL